MSPSSKNNPPSYQIALTAELLQGALKKRLREEGIQITPQQLAVLALLEKQAECVSMHFISEQTFRDNSATTRIIDNLEKAHLAERNSLPGDRRVKLICISDKGREVYGRASEVARQHVEQAIKNISEQDLKVAISVMEKIKDNLKNT